MSTSVTVTAIDTLADRWRPMTASRARWYDVSLVLGGSLLIALAAQIRIPLFPVPATAQTFAIMMIAMALGRSRAVSCVLAYLCQGICGMPVFAGGGAGLAVLAGPTGGYLVGFVVAAWVIGSLADRGWDRRPATTVLAMVLGLAPLYACGVVWLSLFVGAPGFMGVGAYASQPFLQLVGSKLSLAFAVGVVPFLPLAGAKVGFAALFLPGLRHFLGPRRS